MLLQVPPYFITAVEFMYVMSTFDEDLNISKEMQTRKMSAT